MSEAKLGAAIVIVAMIIIGCFALRWSIPPFFSEARFGPPASAFVLNATDLPAGWLLMNKANLTVQDSGFMEGALVMAKKFESGGESSTVFSRAWLFNCTGAAQNFHARHWNETAQGGRREFQPAIENCRGMVRNLPIGGDWTFVFCQSKNLAWEIESRSTANAAHLYAPAFANSVAEKLGARGR